MNKTIIKTALLSVFLFSLIPAVTFVAAVSPSITPTSRAQTRVETVKEANLTRAKTLATSLFEKLFLTKLNALRAKASANETLGTDAKQAVLAKIDTEITWFTQKKDSLDTATTIEQVRAIVREARTRFVTIGRELRRLYIAKGFVVSLENVVKNLENNIVTKLDTKLTELTTAGTDVTAETTKMTSVKAELTAAKTNITMIRNSGTFDTAKKNFDEAKTHVKTARQLLKDILVSLKAKI